MDLEILSSNSDEEFRDKLLNLCKKFNITLGKKVKSLEKVRDLQKGRPRLSIVIDGPTLVYAFKDDYSSSTFF